MQAPLSNGTSSAQRQQGRHQRRHFGASNSPLSLMHQRAGADEASSAAATNTYARFHARPLCASEEFIAMLQSIGGRYFCHRRSMRRDMRMLGRLEHGARRQGMHAFRSRRDGQSRWPRTQSAQISTPPPTFYDAIVRYCRQMAVALTRKYRFDRRVSFRQTDG